MAQQYEVTASDRSGKTVKVFIESDSVRGARSKARSQGLTPLDVNLSDGTSASKAKIAKGSGASAAPAAGGGGTLFRGISTPDVANMTRQLATLIKAHVPVVESLTALVDQINNPRLKKVLIGIRQQVNEGRSLADGFSLYPAIFDRIYVNMVRAGESSGRLDVVLLRLADFTENRVKLKNKVVGAITYPLIMMLVAGAVLGFVLIKVIPTITKIFIDLGQTLPTPTRVLIAISTFAQNYFFHVVIGLLVIAWLVDRYTKTNEGRHKKDRLLLKLPIFGELFRALAVARFARTLGTLLSSGVPMLASLQVTKNVVSNAIFEDILDQAGTLVSEGRSLAYAINQSQEFPPIVTHMVGVGEKTGELENMLVNVADNYELQVENTLGTVTGLLEPLMILVMAVVVGAIVMAVLLPIFEMNQF